jgi:hypothetical protein
MLAKCLHFEGESSNFALLGSETHKEIENAIYAILHKKEYEKPSNQGVEHAIAFFMTCLTRYPTLDWHLEEDIFVNENLPSGHIDLLGVDWFGDSPHAVIIDWKTGYSDYAKPSENLQLLAYAFGVFNRYAHMQTVDLALFLTAKNKLISQTLSRDYIERAFDLNVHTLITAVKNKELYQPVCNQYCSWCAKKTTCKSLIENAISTSDAVQSIGKTEAEIKTKVASMSPASISENLDKYLDMAKLVEVFMGALKHEAIKLLLNGQDVPNYKLTQTIGHRKWTDEEAVKCQLGNEGNENFNIADICELKSPAQCEKILKGKIDKDTLQRILSMYTEKGKGNPKLEKIL